MRDRFQAILNVDLQDGAWTQASLAVNAGGIGVIKSQDLFVEAFISSSDSTELLVDAVLHNTGIPASSRISLREEAQEKWLEKSGSANKLEDSEKYKQKTWDSGFVEKKNSTLFCSKNTDLI